MSATLARYWEDRARRFAAHGAGLKAVCSYGMPAFYNRFIDWTQRRALAPWLHVRCGSRVLDVGCGVGRWSRRLAERGALVTGIDVSPTMVREAERRAHAAGLQARCRFLHQSVTELDLPERFDLILVVTVLQHILDPAALRRALARMAGQLAVGGRLVLLEAAPSRPTMRCNSAVFQARERGMYLRLFAECGLQVAAVGGVDPAPLKTFLLPHLPALPKPVRTGLLALVTLVSIPWDALLARCAIDRSWHAVFVLRAAAEVGA